MPRTKHIAIIGGGFCGAVTAIQLMKNAASPLKITVINSGSPFLKGVAYNAYSNTHLLNVPAGNMSAFADDAEHFVRWLAKKKEYNQYDKELLKNTFVPRNIYGEYLLAIWDETMSAKRADVEVSVMNDDAIDIELNDDNSKTVILKKEKPIQANYVVLATGNSLPRNPPILNTEYYSNTTYFRNPWNVDSVSNLKTAGDVLIIGNGLTMADTVIGLVEHGFKNKIYSLSSNGFGILSHRNQGVKYNALVEEIHGDFEIRRLFAIVKKHIRQVRKLGVSAGPVIDSLRPYSQQIWQTFTLSEKRLFLSRFRYMWGVARHRLPVFIYDLIEKLRVDGQLKVYRGKLINAMQKEDEVTATFYDAKQRCEVTHSFQRIINCTGPETNISNAENPLLRRLSQKGMIASDPLALGLNADVSTYTVISSKGEKVQGIFTLGSNLKGLLWETIAVPELREQCRQVASILLQS